MQTSSLKRPRWLLPGLYLLSLLVLGLLARQIPGPLDADGAYYLLVARNLAQGRGLVIEAVWHFFQPQTGWPQPAGDLWMPLTSLLLAPAMFFGGGFRQAQVVQILLAALLPLLAYRVARDQGAGRPWAGLAALMTLLAGTFTVHWLDTDCFTAYALTGGGTLYALGRGYQQRRWLLPAGLLGGLAAITRNDGILLLVVLWACAWLYSRRQGRPFPWRLALAASGLFLLPVLLWGLRNLLTFGRFNPVPLGFLLTLRDYGRLFAYQPQADWAGFWQQGGAAFLSLRWQGLVASLVVLLGAVQLWGLLPLGWTAAGLRRRPALWPAFGYLLLLLLALLCAFPLLILHGTWSRSLSAFLPTAYASVALGLQQMVNALLRRRPSLPARLLERTFLVLGLAAALLVGGLACSMQLQAARSHPQTWQQVGDWLQQNCATDEVLMAQDPMAVQLYAGRRAIGIPHEELAQISDIAQQYNVRKIVLVGESRQLLPAPLQALYDGAASWELLTPLWRENEVQIYALEY